MKIDETFEKENINPIVGYIFNSAKQLGLENAPNELDWRYLTEGTRRIRKLLERVAAHQPADSGEDLLGEDPLVKLVDELSEHLIKAGHPFRPMDCAFCQKYLLLERKLTGATWATIHERWRSRQSPKPLADSGEGRLIEVLGIDPEGRRVTCGDCGEWVSVDDAIAYDEEEAVRCRKCARAYTPPSPDSSDDLPSEPADGLIEQARAFNQSCESCGSIGRCDSCMADFARQAIAADRLNPDLRTQYAYQAGRKAADEEFVERVQETFNGYSENSIARKQVETALRSVAEEMKRK